MKKTYIVRLSEEERQTCTEVVKKLKGTSQKVRRAHVLLKADVEGPAWTDARISEAFGCRTQTVENLRKRLVTEGFTLALDGKKRRTPPTPPRLDGEGEAQLIAMRFGPAACRLRTLDAAAARGATRGSGSGGLDQS